MKDHPIFMAVAEKAGVDRRGNPLYKRNPDDTEKMVTRAYVEKVKTNGQFETRQRKIIEPEIAGDFPAIGDAYQAFRQKKPEPGAAARPNRAARKAATDGARDRDRGAEDFPFDRNLVTIAKMLLPNLLDGLMFFRWSEGGILRAEKLKKHDLMVESAINMLLQEQRDERDVPRPKSHKQRWTVLSEPCRQAVALATGIDVSFLVELLNAPMQLLIDQRVGVRQGDTVFVESSLLTPEIDAVFRKLALQPQHDQTLPSTLLLRYRPPSYWGDSPNALIAERATINWTAYYPCYIAHSPANMSRVYLTSPRVWQGMLMALAERPAYTLHQVDETLARDVAARDELSELRRLIRETHREIEELAGQAATDAGWRCRTSVEAFGAIPLPEGEVDLLATANIGDASVILLERK